MKRTLIIVCAAWLALSASAETKDPKLQSKLDEVKAHLEDFNTERLLDSLDQEKLPRLVSGGLFGGGNVSNFIITRNHQTFATYMRIGAELGGFMDFHIAKHFAIQPQVIMTAHQNYFDEGDERNRLWSFGVEIPLYFLGRFGNMEKGYIQFGGGIYTHFTYLSNIQGKYTNVDEPETKLTMRKAGSGNSNDYDPLLTLHNNHFGFCAMVGYEFWFGMQINAQYKVSVSDIAGFYKDRKGSPEADALLYPQSVSLSVGYRWK